MLTRPVAVLLRSARRSLGLTQKALAQRAGVSHRLWAEVERGERPNVSLETALRMLAEAGITLRLSDSLGQVQVLRGRAAARARMRQAHWTMRQTRRGQRDSDDAPGASGPDGIDAVSLISEQMYTVATARPTRARRR